MPIHLGCPVDPKTGDAVQLLILADIDEKPFGCRQRVRFPAQPTHLLPMRGAVHRDIHVGSSADGGHRRIAQVDVKTPARLAARFPAPRNTTAVTFCPHAVRNRASEPQ